MLSIAGKHLPEYCSTVSNQPSPEKPPREPMRLQGQQRHDRHSAHPPSTPGKMPRTKQGTLCYLFQPHKMEDMNRGALFAKDCSSWRTIHWPQRERSQIKRYTACLKKSLAAFHVYPVCWSDIAADRDSRVIPVIPGAILSSKRLTSSMKTEETCKRQGKKKMSSSSLRHNTRRYFLMWPLLTALPFLHWARQSSACLQTMWTDSLFSFAKPGHNYSQLKASGVHFSVSQFALRSLFNAPTNLAEGFLVITHVTFCMVTDISLVQSSSFKLRRFLSTTRP